MKKIVYEDGLEELASLSSEQIAAMLYSCLHHQNADAKKLGISSFQMMAAEKEMQSVLARLSGAL